MTLRTERICTLDQIRAFLEGNEPADFELTDRNSAYAFVRRRWSGSSTTASGSPTRDW